MKNITFFYYLMFWIPGLGDILVYFSDTELENSDLQIQFFGVVCFFFFLFYSFFSISLCFSILLLTPVLFSYRSQLQPLTSSFPAVLPVLLQLQCVIVCSCRVRFSSSFVLFFVAATWVLFLLNVFSFELCPHSCIQHQTNCDKMQQVLIFSHSSLCQSFGFFVTFDQSQWDGLTSVTTASRSWVH